MKTHALAYGYHAHVYYDDASKPAATALRQAVGEGFDVKIGSWHDEPVGPHPRWSYQLAFEPKLFGEIVAWLALNRNGLTVFIHPETGNALADHQDYALWMGEMLELNLDLFQ